MTDKTTRVDPIVHDALRANIPSAEMEPVLRDDDKAPIRTAWARRNRDLDPQLVWRGKDPDQETLTVEAPPIYLQEQVHPKALIDDLRAGRERADDLFGHFGLTPDDEGSDREAEVEFYRHSRKWSNRMILGDALQVMASLAEREGLRGQVQAIYIDPPYGIRFNSNFQWSTTSRDVKDGNLAHLTREPEQVKAFRDTWRDGIHSYLAYLRDRLTVARELLTDSGSCFVQIGDENVHRVRALMDEVFGERNFVAELAVKKTSGAGSPAIGTNVIAQTFDYIVWFAKSRERVKYRQLYTAKTLDDDVGARFRRIELPDGTRRPMQSGERSNQSLTGDGTRIYRHDNLNSQSGGPTTSFPIDVDGIRFPAGRSYWKTNALGVHRLRRAWRLGYPTPRSVSYVRFLEDFAASPVSNMWTDVLTGAFTDEKTYVVQTGTKIVQRCLLMTTDPGDLVLDPTCGSGTTAYVAEQWGRRWITIDTSRVALALARARIMGAKYPWYILADSAEGQRKAAEVERRAPATHATHDDIRHGFVYERVPHVTLKSIANNAEIDVIWDRLQPAVEAARAALNAALSGHATPFPITTGGRAGQALDFRATGEVTLPSGEPAPAGGFMEWEVPRPPAATPEKVSGQIADAKPTDSRQKADTVFTADWPAEAVAALRRFWDARIARQREIDASIAAKADHEYLYDKPYEDKKRIRVAGPFTVESLSPHRIQPVDEHGDMVEDIDAGDGLRMAPEREAENYRLAIMENLEKAGVHQSGKADAIRFDSLTAWPGEWIAAEGRYREGEVERRAGVFIGPEYGTVSRADLVDCAREAADAGFDIVIACAFNFEAHAQEFHRLGRIPILHARMNADLHMAGELKAGGGNLFVVFGEPDIELRQEGDHYRVELKGVDIYRPATGKVETSEPDDIACWFIDTDYSGESFFVRHAYFPGAEVPYKALRSTLKGEIDEEAWDSLKLTVSRPFAKPKSGRIAVKVINHLGDEVMKVMGV